MFTRPKTFEECTARRKRLYEEFNLIHIDALNWRGRAYGNYEAADEYNWLASIHGKLPHAPL